MKRRVLQRRVLQFCAVAGCPVIAGCFVVNRAIDETYSRDWASASTENAKYRRVFVSSPTIAPAVLPATDSIDVHVTDAWIEHPTHVEYRWLFWRREIQDSTYRFVLHFVQTPHSSGLWSAERARCFASYDLVANDGELGRSGNADVHIGTLESRTPLRDTIRLTLRRHPRVAPPPGAAPIDWCPGA